MPPNKRAAEIIETKNAYIPAGDCSWFRILSCWQDRRPPPCKLFINSVPLATLIIGLEKNNIIGFLHIFLRELLSYAQVEMDLPPDIAQYLDLIQQYNIPSNITHADQYDFHKWIQSQPQIKSMDRAFLLNTRLRHSTLLSQHINDKNDPICQYLSFFDILRSLFNTKGEITGWHSMLYHRLHNKGNTYDGNWSVAINLAPLPDGRIKLSEKFIFADTSVDINPETDLKKIEGSNVNPFFSGRYEFEYLPEARGIKGRCTLAELSIYDDNLDESLKHPCLVELILKDQKDLKKQLSSVPNDNTNHAHLDARSIISSALIDYLTQTITASQCISIIEDNPDYLVGNVTNKTFHFINQMLDLPVIPLSDKICFMLKLEEMKLNHPDRTEDSLPIIQKIKLIKGAEQYLTQAITTSEFEKMISDNKAYIEASSGTQFNRLLEQLRSNDTEHCLAKLESFIVQNKDNINNQDYTLLKQMKAYLNNTLSEIILFKNIALFPFDTRPQMLVLFNTMLECKPSFILSLLSQKATTTIELKKLKIQESADKLMVESQHLEVAIDYLTTDTHKDDFLNHMNTLTHQTFNEKSKYIIEQTLLMKTKFILNDIQSTLEGEDISKEDKTLLNKATQYLENQIKLAEFQHACMNYPESSRKFSTLLNKVVDDKPMLDKRDE